MARLNLQENATSPPTPAPGFASVYFKTDNVLYIKDSSGTETAIGTASGITQLTGDVTATGPGVVPATVVQVGGASAANIASAVTAYLAATSANIAGTIVKRDGSGNISVQNLTAAGTVTGSNLSGSNTGDVTIGTANGLSIIGQVISLALSSASTTGALSSTDWSNFNSKVANNDNRLLATNVLRVKQNPGTGEFSSIRTAINSISGNSSSNPFTVLISPGVYVEDPIVLKSFVAVTAEGFGSVTVHPNDPSMDLFTINSSACKLQGLNIENVTGVSTAGVRITASPSPAILDFVTITNCTENIVIESNATAAQCLLSSTRLNSGAATINIARIQANSGQLSILRIFTGILAEGSGALFQNGFLVTGTGANLDANSLIMKSVTAVGNGIKLSNGGLFTSESGTIVEGFDKNVWAENTGAAPSIRTTTVMLRTGVTWDLLIDHPGTTGSMMAKVDTDDGVSINPSAPLKLVLTDPDTTNSVGLFVKGDILQADRFDRRANLSLVARKATTLGVVNGGSISIVSGLQINIASGQGFLDDPIDLYLKEINWTSTNLTLSANTNNYIYVDTNAVVTANSVLPSFQTVIPLGRVVAGASSIDFIEHSELSMVHIGNRVEVLLRDGLGSLFGQGAIVTENVTPRKLDVTGGEYFFGSSIFDISGGAAVSWESIYQDGSGGFIFGTQDTADNAFYDNGSGTLAAIPANNYVKHTLYVLGDNGSEKYFLVYAQATHAALVDAQNDPLPLIPSFMTDAVVRIAGIIIKQGQNNIVETIDIRPRLGFAAPASTAASDHGNLTGLLDDDHPQYLIRTGIRPMTGPLTSTDTTQSIDKDTGSIVTDGGIGADKNINSGGNINAVGTVTGSNLSGTNTGDVTITDTNSIDLSLTGQNLSSDLKLSSDAADSGNLKATTTVHSGAGAGLHIEYPFATPVQIGTSNFIGAASSFALSDHVHSHGNQTSGTLHAAVTTSVNGFMSAADKTKLDTNVPNTLGTSNQVLGVNNAGTAAEYKTLSGTTDQVIITDGVGSKTFSLPQSINTTSSPTFANITDSGLTAKGAMFASTAGLLSSTGALTNGQLLVGSTGINPVAAAITGTANQVNVTNGAGSITLSTPQDIATSSTPTFAGENLTDRLELTEQVVPVTPAATKLDIFTEASNGFTRLRTLDSSGLKSTLLRDTLILVKNTTGSTIAAGKGVYYTGTDAGTSLPLIALAKADSSLTIPCVGITQDSIANNAVGRVTALGICTNIDTSAFAQGDKLYLSATTAGSFTATKPTSPNIWQRIGIVLISNVGTGAIEVRPFATHGEESGTNTAYTLNTVALVDGANIATDASLGNNFTVTLGGNRNLSAPTNPKDGQKIVYRITQDGTGGRGLTFDAIFNFGLDIISFVPSTAANKVDYIGCIYSSAQTRWNIVAVSKGF